MTAAVRTFVVRPAWHLARVAQWTARLVTDRPGAHQRLLEDAQLHSRQLVLNASGAARDESSGAPLMHSSLHRAP